MRYWAALLLFIQLSSPVAHAEPAAGVAGALSIIPGLGQTIEGEPLEGAAWFAAATIPFFVIGNNLFRQIGFDLWMYNMYDAYRDAKPNIGRYTTFNVYQNYFANLNPLNLSDPVGAGTVAVGAYSGLRTHGGYPCLKYGTCPPMYGFVGLGEEGFFRGFLFPSFSDITSSTWAGAILSSGVFAAAHALGGKENLTLVPMASRFFAGMVFAWQAHRNNYDLRSTIFAHSWFDILVTDAGRIQGAQIRFPIAF